MQHSYYPTLLDEYPSCDKSKSPYKFHKKSITALPDPYVTINPEMLNDPTWSYRDLQLLCMRLHLGGKGKRVELVEKLLDWHRKQFNKVNKQQYVHNYISNKTNPRTNIQTIIQITK